MKSPSGFTLIEMSIVLVIIGLVVGSVVVGRDLIHAAELRGTVRQVEQFNAAVSTFRVKYNCLPGDCASATNWGMEAGSNGNGDGMIGLCSSSSACYWTVGNSSLLSPEYLNFWYHLTFANLLEGKYDSSVTTTTNVAGMASPKLKIGSNMVGGVGGWGVIGEAPFHAAIGGGVFPAHSLFTSSLSADGLSNLNVGILSPSDAYAIDSKVDDGLPAAGKTRGWYISSTSYALGPRQFGSQAGVPMGIGAGGSSAAVCVRNDTTPSQYNVQYTGNSQPGVCGLVIKAAF